MVEGQKIYVHRAILYSRSKHFGNMFTSGMRECEERVVIINDAPYVSFKVRMRRRIHVSLMRRSIHVSVHVYHDQ